MCPGARWARLAAALSWFILVRSLGAESTGFFALSSIKSSWAFETSWNFRASNFVQDFSLFTNKTPFNISAESIQWWADISSREFQKLLNQVLSRGNGEVEDEVVSLAAEVIDTRLR